VRGIRNISAVIAVLLIAIVVAFNFTGKETDHPVFSIDDRKTIGALLPINPETPLQQRVAPIPTRLLNLWQKADRAMNPVAATYRSYELSPEQQRAFADAIATLPESWQRTMRSKLSRFYFVENLLGGGITSWIIDADGNLTYTMILNPALFHATASQWLQMKEGASFKKGELTLLLKGAEGISALQMLLWHESAHLIDYEAGHTLAVDSLLRQYKHIEQKQAAFTQGIWNMEGKPKPLFEIPQLERLNPYGMDNRKPLLPNRDLAQTFEALANSPFVSFYAATSPMEDYAELAAFAIAGRQTGIFPYWALSLNGKVVVTFAPLAHPLNRQRLGYFDFAAELPRLISEEDISIIGEKIFLNECGGKVENLTAWNEGEAFPSLGIGHFIWYPAGTTGPFRESFPELIAFMQQNHVEIPHWIAEAVHSGAPWPSKEQFLSETNTEKLRQLRQFLLRTRTDQTRFMIARMRRSLPEILKTLPGSERQNIASRFEAVASAPLGYYALVDYVNFKGEGIRLEERYNGHGWGLLQVLVAMPADSRDALAAFADAAKEVLARRVANAPPERNEQRWLPGWKHRIDSYTPVNSNSGS